MDIRRCYELFLTDRKVSGCSEATLRFYEYVIGKLLRYIEENDLDSSVESIHQHILPFFSYLQQQNLSASTYHTLFRGLRAFTRFLHQENYVKDEIRLPKVKQPHTTISPLNPSQMKAILHSLQRILGHTDQTTTSKYVNMARSNVKAQHSKCSPGERL